MVQRIQWKFPMQFPFNQIAWNSCWRRPKLFTQERTASFRMHCFPPDLICLRNATQHKWQTKRSERASATRKTVLLMSTQCASMAGPRTRGRVVWQSDLNKSDERNIQRKEKLQFAYKTNQASKQTLHWQHRMHLNVVRAFITSHTIYGRVCVCAGCNWNAQRTYRAVHIQMVCAHFGLHSAMYAMGFKHCSHCTFTRKCSGSRATHGHVHKFITYNRTKHNQ